MVEWTQRYDTVSPPHTKGLDVCFFGWMQLSLSLSVCDSVRTTGDEDDVSGLVLGITSFVSLLLLVVVVVGVVVTG